MTMWNTLATLMLGATLTVSASAGTIGSSAARGSAVVSGTIGQVTRTPSGTGASTGSEAGSRLESSTPSSTLRTLAQSEREYRLRKAQIRRLRVLAHERGDTARLAELDRVNVRLDRLHKRTIAGARPVLGDTTFRRAESELRRGRLGGARSAGGTRGGNLGGNAEPRTRDVGTHVEKTRRVPRAGGGTGGAGG